MSAVQERRVGSIAYREAVPDGQARGEALLVHGYPESSMMWVAVLEALAAQGVRAVALDLPGAGDSPPDLPRTWERQVEALESFRAGVRLERPALVTHDWGGLVGLWWACEHPDRVAALVLSDTGFFPEGKWHGLARALRTEGEGEEVLASVTLEGFTEVMRQTAPGIDPVAVEHYWRGQATPEGRQGVLDLYRSGDFSKLERFDGALAALGVPTLILWGAHDDFAPVAGAHRFAREIAHSELVVLDDAGHFLFDTHPERTAAEVARFLGGVYT